MAVDLKGELFKLALKKLMNFILKMLYKLFLFFITFYLIFLSLFTILNVFSEQIHFKGYSFGVTTSKFFFLTSNNFEVNDNTVQKVVRQNIKNDYTFEEVASFDGIKYLTLKDDYIFQSELLGKVIYSSNVIGTVASYLKSKYGVIAFYIIPISALYLYFFYWDEIKKRG